MNDLQRTLRERFIYNPLTGEFAIRKTGEHVTARVRGYLVVSYGGKHCKVHRIIWALVTGEWPEVIDHKDRDRFNNRWDNLRDVTQAVNLQNKSLYKNSKTGHAGVTQLGPKSFKVRVFENGKTITLGQRGTLEAAVQLRTAYKQRTAHV